MKRLKLALFVIVVILYLPTTLTSQKNYKKAYIITSENDTLLGLIHVNSKFDQSKKCEFLRNNSKEWELLSPYEVKSIKTDDKYYASKEITMDNVEKKVFIEVVFEGVVNGYCLDIENFYIEKGDSLYHLSNEEKEFIDKYGDKYSFESNKYLGIIAYIIQDEPLLVQKIKNTALTSKSLVEIFKQYCEKTCPDCNFVDYTEKRKHSVFVEPQIGFNYAKLRFPTSDDYDTYLTPALGINIHIPSLRNNRWDYKLGVHFSSYKFEGDYNHSIYGKKETYRVRLDYSTLNIPLIIEYSLSDKKIQPAIKLGYNNVIIINQDNSLALIYNESYIIEKDSKMRLYQYGFIAGAGIKYKINSYSLLQVNCNVEFRMPYLDTQYFYDKQKTSSLQLNIGYSFRIR